MNLGTGGSAYNALMVNNPLISATDKKAGTGAIAFTASSLQYVRIPAFTTSSSGLTFAFWFKFAGSLFTSRILDFGNGAGMDNIVIGLDTSGDLITYQFNLNAVGASVSAVTGLNVNDGVWRHVALVIDSGGNWKVYLNGVLTRTIANEYYPPSKTRVLNYLGKSNWATDSYSNGAIDEFYVYFSVLSASDVLALYNAG